MYSKAFKGAVAVPAAAVLPQTGNGIMGTVLAALGAAVLVVLAVTTLMARRRA